jgi:hypothetical protein
VDGAGTGDVNVDGYGGFVVGPPGLRGHRALATAGLRRRRRPCDEPPPPAPADEDPGRGCASEGARGMFGVWGIAALLV